MIGKLLRGVSAGEHRTMWYEPFVVAAPDSLILQGTDFSDGGKLPASSTSRGIGRSPGLSWSGVPAVTRSLVLIVEDPDAPLPRPFVHAVAIINPSAERLPPGALNDGTEPIIARGRNSFGRRTWAASAPPAGHGRHRYVFQLFALSADASTSLHGRRDVRRLLRGSLLARGKLTGTDER